MPKETEEELKDKYEEILGDGVDIYVIFYIEHFNSFSLLRNEILSSYDIFIMPDLKALQAIRFGI